MGTKIENITGLSEESDEVLFFLDNGDTYRMYHSQDCCEYVRIEDICGDVSDLIDATILHFEERVEEGGEDRYGTSTITFYDIQTDKGCVNIRWLGESNGYYSESVSFEKLNTRKAVIKLLPKKIPPQNPMNLFPQTEPKKQEHPDIIKVVLCITEYEWETTYFYVIQSEHPDYVVGTKYTFNESLHMDLTSN